MMELLPTPSAVSFPHRSGSSPSPTRTMRTRSRRGMAAYGARGGAERSAAKKRVRLTRDGPSRGRVSAPAGRASVMGREGRVGLGMGRGEGGRGGGCGGMEELWMDVDVGCRRGWMGRRRYREGGKEKGGKQREGASVRLQLTRLVPRGRRGANNAGHPTSSYPTSPHLLRSSHNFIININISHSPSTHSISHSSVL
jgi:hypothetical protein